MTDPEGVAESQAEYTGLPETDEAISAAFGATNRRRLLGSYFKGGSVTAANAWEHVYRLLLWTDQTTGLAHCYESDKSQPGKPWYARSLAFHDWLARALNATPAKLGEEIDWMFQRAAKELAAHVLRSAGAVATLAGKQRKMYEGREFPSPGTDPELIAIVRETLGEHLTEPPPAVWSQLVERVRRYFALDYKRKNLLGEGFEDVLGEVITQSCSGPKAPKVYVRELLNVLGGFSNQKVGAKPNKVDVALVRPTMRTIVTAKWSVRADREKQFPADFGDYVNAESDGKPWEYVFVTNEFDPARLVRACERLASNAPLFTRVVHINTDGLEATYAKVETGVGKKRESNMARAIEHIRSGRLMSLEKWLLSLQD